MRSNPFEAPRAQVRDADGADVSLGRAFTLANDAFRDSGGALTVAFVVWSVAMVLGTFLLIVPGVIAACACYLKVYPGVIRSFDERVYFDDFTSDVDLTGAWGVVGVVLLSLVVNLPSTLIEMSPALLVGSDPDVVRAAGWVTAAMSMAYTVVAGGATLMALWRAAVDKASAVDAMAWSFEQFARHPVTMMVGFGILYPLLFGGMLMCFIGLFPAVAYTLVLQGAIYAQLTGRQ
jgi:hypothetical protein